MGCDTRMRGRLRRSTNSLQLTIEMMIPPIELIIGNCEKITQHSFRENIVFGRRIKGSFDDKNMDKLGFLKTMWMGYLNEEALLFYFREETSSCLSGLGKDDGPAWTI